MRRDHLGQLSVPFPARPRELHRLVQSASAKTSRGVYVHPSLQARWMLLGRSGAAFEFLHDPRILLRVSLHDLTPDLLRFCRPHRHGRCGNNLILPLLGVWYNSLSISQYLRAPRFDRDSVIRSAIPRLVTSSEPAFAHRRPSIGLRPSGHRPCTRFECGTSVDRRRPRRRLPPIVPGAPSSCAPTQRRQLRD
jgi:hypothetical protein